MLLFDLIGLVLWVCGWTCRIFAPGITMCSGIEAMRFHGLAVWSFAHERHRAFSFLLVHSMDPSTDEMIA